MSDIEQISSRCARSISAPALALRQGRPIGAPIGARPRKRQHKIENQPADWEHPYGRKSVEWNRQKTQRKSRKGLGRVTGDARTQAEGQLKQTEGSIQDLYGQAIDSAGDTIESAKMTATSAEDTIRDFIENRPYATAAIALGLGWLIGRLHRPF